MFSPPTNSECTQRPQSCPCHMQWDSCFLTYLTRKWKHLEYCTDRSASYIVKGVLEEFIQYTGDSQPLNIELLSVSVGHGAFLHSPLLFAMVVEMFWVVSVCIDSMCDYSANERKRESSPCFQNLRCRKVK